DYTPWGSSNSFSNEFTDQGTYSINVQVRDGQGGETASVVSLNIAAPELSGQPAIVGSQMAFDGVNQQLWVINPDNDTLTRVDPQSNSVDLEVATQPDPRGVALDGQGRVWLTSRDRDVIQVMDE